VGRGLQPGQVSRRRCAGSGNMVSMCRPRAGLAGLEDLPESLARPGRHSAAEGNPRARHSSTSTGSRRNEGFGAGMGLAERSLTTNHDLMDLFGPKLIGRLVKGRHAVVSGGPGSLNDYANHDISRRPRALQGAFYLRPPPPKRGRAARRSRPARPHRQRTERPGERARELDSYATESPVRINRVRRRTPTDEELAGPTTRGTFLSCLLPAFPQSSGCSIGASGGRPTGVRSARFSPGLVEKPSARPTKPSSWTSGAPGSRPAQAPWLLQCARFPW